MNPRVNELINRNVFLVLQSTYQFTSKKDKSFHFKKINFSVQLKAHIILEWANYSELYKCQSLFYFSKLKSRHKLLVANKYNRARSGNTFSLLSRKFVTTSMKQLTCKIGTKLNTEFFQIYIFFFDITKIFTTFFCLETLRGIYPFERLKPL